MLLKTSIFIEVLHSHMIINPYFWKIVVGCQNNDGSVRVGKNIVNYLCTTE
jgi:hypothetical protein